jgi:hypothetical protein
MYIGIVTLGNFLLLLAVFVVVALRKGWRPIVRQFLNFQNPFWGIVCLILPFLILWMVIFPWIGEAVLLRYYYTPEEIERENLRVVKIIGKREVVFSNGERRPYESYPKRMLVGICVALSLPLFALVCWCLHRSGNQLFQLPGQERVAAQRRTAEPSAPADGGRDPGFS